MPDMGSPSLRNEISFPEPIIPHISLFVPPKIGKIGEAADVLTRYNQIEQESVRCNSCSLYCRDEHCSSAFAKQTMLAGQASKFASGKLHSFRMPDEARSADSPVDCRGPSRRAMLAATCHGVAGIMLAPTNNIELHYKFQFAGASISKPAPTRRCGLVQLFDF